MTVATLKTTPERLLARDRRALARLITWAENAHPRFPGALREIYGHVGRARRLGVTGPPGVGKSTLCNGLVSCLRERGSEVGVLAVDPSSPFTGGALLGDRIRMESHTKDPGVFVRSMASRDSHGGLARAAVDACDVMDAFGFDELILETVGVGQAEYDIVSAADTVIVVLCPGAGDSVQAMKAGLLEVADVLVVNKNDAPGADRLVSDLEDAVALRRESRDGWTTPVVRSSAGRGLGLEDVLAAVEQQRTFLGSAGLAARRRKMRVAQVQRTVGELLVQALWSDGCRVEFIKTALASGRPPYDVADEMRDQIL
ncbi:MAG TPA: methylmalonyl Co-A mutase-associated GTPase MeaB [Planctomycetes bacterium]|jgi:LAO/AO transport system kinase|nr:methylmalonyl Co-A mutase-associated GTPase MeaB [Planctomycetota bacterium]HIL53195.1 methylmalonyl Co-A mutase-associated GTPase MeaB [Planctomycetota bacterium]